LYLFPDCRRETGASDRQERRPIVGVDARVKPAATILHCGGLTVDRVRVERSHFHTAGMVRHDGAGVVGRRSVDVRLSATAHGCCAPTAMFLHAADHQCRWGSRSTPREPRRELNSNPVRSTAATVDMFGSTPARRRSASGRWRFLKDDVRRLVRDASSSTACLRSGTPGIRYWRPVDERGPKRGNGVARIEVPAVDGGRLYTVGRCGSRLVPTRHSTTRLSRNDGQGIGRRARRAKPARVSRTLEIRGPSPCSKVDRCLSRAKMEKFFENLNIPAVRYSKSVASVGVQRRKGDYDSFHRRD